jgi:hypothetical protein
MVGRKSGHVKHFPLFDAPYRVVGGWLAPLERMREYFYDGTCSETHMPELSTMTRGGSPWLMK